MALRLRQIPLGEQLPLLVPESSWRRPRELPDLRGRPMVALDTECKDDGLAAGRGPGWATGAGHVCGVAWSAEGSSGYAPIRHPDSDCFPAEQVSRWLQDLVRSGTRLVFQNAPYDLGWLHADLGVDVPMEYPIEDPLCADFMRDENEYEYNLDAILRRLGLPGKDEKLLREAAEAYLRPAGALRSWRLSNRDLKSNLWRLPARFVGPYAEPDAIGARAAVERLLPILEEQRVTEAYRLEMDLVPMVLRMRAGGIRVNVERAVETRDAFRAKREAALAEMARRLPGRGAITMERLRQTRWMESVFYDEGITPPRTAPTERHAEGQASFRQDWMEAHPHWLPQMVSRALQYDRFAETFVDEYVLGFCHRGRLHAEVHQYKSDDGGTVSYRFAYSNPPLQQAPSADIDPEFGLAFRELFEAEGIWGACDYKQQEYKLTAHFAAVCRVRGGEEAARQFNENPSLDFHDMVAALTGLTRAKAKIQNFALLYGQGLAATAAKLGVSEEEAARIRKQVEDSAPFGPALDDFLRSRAQQRGFLRLLDGARVRFDEWEAGWISREEWQRGRDEKLPMEPCSLEEARRRRADERHPWHGSNLRRAGVRKALNRCIQGSAARQTKLAMRECGREGLVPLLQMHDELDFDVDDPGRVRRAAEIMSTVVRLRVPMSVDVGCGRTWAEAKAKGAKKPEDWRVPVGTRTGRAGHALNRLIRRGD